MIGLIFGETDFPKLILKKIKNKKKHLIIDLTSKKIFKKNKNSYSVSLGQFGKILEIFKKNNCKKALFAGRVEKPNFLKLKLDLKGIFYIPRIIKSSKIGDAAILKEIINIFKKEKIQTINSLAYTPNLNLKAGIYTKTKPNKFDNQDIKKGIYTLNKTNKYGNSQAVVIIKNKIIAIEGKGGTKKMLIDIKKKKPLIKSGVLIKLPKQKQDLRIDLPVIGMKTLLQCRDVNLKGIYLKNKNNIFLEQKKCIKFANKNKMFIAVK